MGILREMYNAFMDELFNGGYYEMRDRVREQVAERQREGMYDADRVKVVSVPKPLLDNLVRQYAERERKREQTI